MNLEFQQLQQILTSETLLATDHLSKHLETSNTHDYDVLFAIVFERLQPLIAEDHPIDVGVRAQLFRGICERTPLDKHTKTTLEKAYSEFIETNSSKDLQMFIANRTTIKGMEWVYNETPVSFFYGPWMPEMPLKEALKYMKDPIRSAMHNLRENVVRRPTQQQRSVYLNMSVDEKCKQLLKLYNDEHRNVDQFKFAVGALKSHPKFNELLNYVLSEADYANFTLTDHPLLDFDNYVTTSQQPLLVLKNELVALNQQFQEKKIKLIGEHWISDVVRRCEKLLISMAQEPMVTVSKTSIEQFRAKESPTENIEEGHLKFKQQV